MTLTPIDALGMLGTLLNIWGNILIARQALTGWWVRIACNAVWIAHACLRPDASVLANAVAFLFINAYGIWKWRRIERRHRAAQVIAFDGGRRWGARRGRRW